MKNLTFLLVGLLVIMVGCDKEPDIKLAEDDYLIFGHFYGLCVGEQCIEIFRLESDQLLEDTNDDYPNQISFYNADYVLLPNSKFAAVQGLMDAFPPALMNETDKVIGMPDAGDWGGLYIEISTNGAHKFWLIDQMDSNLPTYLVPFHDEINNAINLINQ